MTEGVAANRAGAVACRPVSLLNKPSPLGKVGVKRSDEVKPEGPNRAGAVACRPVSLLKLFSAFNISSKKIQTRYAQTWIFSDEAGMHKIVS